MKQQAEKVYRHIFQSSFRSDSHPAFHGEKTLNVKYFAWTVDVRPIIDADLCLLQLHRLLNLIALACTIAGFIIVFAYLRLPSPQTINDIVRRCFYSLTFRSRNDGVHGGAHLRHL